MAKLQVFFASVFLLVSFVCALQCGENQEEQFCGSSCPDYCNRKAELELCTMNCVHGCGCKANYTKEAIDSNRCIKKEECSKVPTCPGRFQVYKTCGSSCPKYCGQPADQACNKMCKQECQCKDGYVKKTRDSSECVFTRDCTA